MIVKGSQGLLYSETGNRIGICNKEWHLNLGLLMPVYDRTEDPELKRRIGFLAIQYLARASHIDLSDLTPNYQITATLQSYYHLGVFQESMTYHRSSSTFERYFSESFEKEFVPQSGNLFLLTDTADFAHLLPLYFTVLPLNQEEWGASIEHASSPLLLDLTSLLTDSIQSDEQSFEEKWRKYAEVKEILIICRCEIKGVGIVKILSQEFQEGYHHLTTFLNLTGLRLGGVRARERLFQFLDFKEFLKLHRSIHLAPHHLTKWAPEGENSCYFANKEDLLKTQIFQRFAKTKASAPFNLLIRATSSLLQGLMIEISKEKWEELNKNHETRELLQAILMRILQHLAKSTYQLDDFSHFTSTIELIHCEIASLLILTSPFQGEDFEVIYKKHLTHIPKELHGFVKVGIAKSAMHLFAETLSQSAQPVMLPGIYHEQQPLIGKENTIGKILENSEIEEVDLFVSEFNPNINKDISYAFYTVRNPIQDITSLLKTKPKSIHLTILMDSTIDYVGSNKAGALLAHFSKEIKEGKLNFIFMRSGQKFDMLGMDNYYGSPYYIINNGDKQWLFYETLLKEKSAQTDPLSIQWFCLSNKYAFEKMEEHRAFVFSNTRMILKEIPESLLPDQEGPIRISQFEKEILPCFIDIKIHSERSLFQSIRKIFLNTFQSAGCKVYSKPGFGFLSPNFLSFSTDEGAPKIIRINPGIDPQENAIFAQFFINISKII